jgi:PAS domain S-box-containing protein
MEQSEQGENEVPNSSYKHNVLSLKEAMMENLQAKVVELEQENARLRAAMAQRLQVEEPLRESESKFRNLAEQSPNIIFIYQKGRVVYANQQCVNLTGYSRRELYAAGFDFVNLIAPEYIGTVETMLAKLAQGEDVPPYEYRLLTKTGHWIEAINASKVIRYGGETAILGIVTDITERKQAELAIGRANDELQQHVEELSTLNLIAQTVTTITNLDTLLGVVAGTLSQLFGAYSTEISLLTSRNSGSTMCVRHYEDETLEKRGEPIVRLDRNPAAQRVAATGQPLLVLRAQTNPLTEPIHQVLQAHNIQSFMSVPMVARGQTIGLITIYTNQPNRDFTQVDVGLAETIAGQIAGAVETARLFGQEQERRQEIERRRLIAESLGDILAVLNSDQPLEDTLDYIATQANQLLDTDASAIYRQESTADEPFSVLAAQGYCAEEIALAVIYQVTLAEMRNLLLELHPAVLVEKPMSELLRQLADV